MLISIVILVGILLAYANGANDNFKGVATLYGSRTAPYRGALILATGATALGSLAALLVAGRLLQAFSGNGLVPPDVVADPAFPASVGLGAALTVLLATRLGFPISTTHALTGALVGAGLAASRMHVDAAYLVNSFFLPLAVSPILAVLLTGMAFRGFGQPAARLRSTEEFCVCVGERPSTAFTRVGADSQALAAVPSAAISVDRAQSCDSRGWISLARLKGTQFFDAPHYLSAGAVSFARGLNDTPKIAALLLAAPAVGSGPALAAVGVAIAAGGLLHARKVAETVSRRITEMGPAEGLTANLVTSLLVIGASRWGMPVSTTHVSCGALVGVGAVSGGAHWRMIGQILLAWLVTLPLAGILAAGSVAILTHVL